MNNLIANKQLLDKIESTRKINIGRAGKILDEASADFKKFFRSLIFCIVHETKPK